MDGAMMFKKTGFGGKQPHQPPLLSVTHRDVHPSSPPPPQQQMPRQQKQPSSSDEVKMMMIQLAMQAMR
jgi:hypothetical protein